MLRKFVILTNPRTGSEYLVRLLNEHPAVHCLGEVFAIPPGDKVWNQSVYKTSNQPFAYLASLQEKSSKPWFGYKQISNWLSNSGFADASEFIEKSRNESFSFIFIERENLLKEYVSFMIMMEQNYGHIDSEHGQMKRITINVKHAYAQMRRWDAFNQSCKKAFSNLGISYLKLTYENDFDENKQVKNKVFDFLEVARVDVPDPLKPTNPFRLEEMIVNFDEVMDFMTKKRRFISWHAEPI